METPTKDFPELVESTESLPPIKTPLEVAQDEIQAMCDRVQALRRKIWQASNEITKACYKGQLIEVVKQLTNARLDYAADGINVAVSYSNNGCPIRVMKSDKREFYE